MADIPVVVPIPPSNEAYRALDRVEAEDYLDEIQVLFVEEVNKWNAFLQILRDYKLTASMNQELGIPQLISQVFSLLRGNPDLIQRFEIFLPGNFAINCTVSTPEDPGSGRLTLATPTGPITQVQGSNTWDVAQ